MLYFICVYTDLNSSIQQLGATFGELFIPPPTPNNPYPPLPLELDDEYIFADRIEQQPTGKLSKLAGFNLNVRIYSTVTPLATMELAYGIDEVFDWNRQKRLLEDSLLNVKRVLDDIPSELRLETGSQPGDFQGLSSYYPPNSDFPGLRANGADSTQWPDDEAKERRRLLQFEIQKANIYASQLGTRSSFVDKYCNLQDAYNAMQANADQMTTPSSAAIGFGLPVPSVTGNSETNVAEERESIVKDLLEVLSCISQVNMEPNGGSFVCFRLLVFHILCTCEF